MENNNTRDEMMDLILKTGLLFLWLGVMMMILTRF